MNLREIVKDWLVGRGYEGLFNSDGPCACKLDDLMPCGDPSSDGCMPGYLAPCPGSESEVCDGDCEFHIVPSRPKANADGL